MMRKIRTVAVFPTMFTLGNLVCGFFAVVVAARVERPVSIEQSTSPEIPLTSIARAINQLDPYNDTHNVMLSGCLIFLAMIFDALDGHVARLSRTTSDFGAQLDSICDAVTFGVAPGFLLVKMCPYYTFRHPHMVWIIAASYAACAALRLARFNVESSEEDDHMHFSGLPSPAAAAAIAGFAILFYELRRDTNTLPNKVTIDLAIQSILPFFAVLIGVLMVSRVPYPHVVNQMLRGQRSFGHVVGLLFALAAIMSVYGYSVPLICCLFVLIAPVRYVWQRLHQPREQQESIF